MAPTTVLPPGTPCVGIFWLVGDVLLIDGSSLDAAEPYGGCLTHAAGHFDSWEDWAKLPASKFRRLGYPLEVRFTEYDDWPRGRIVYDVSKSRFTLYCDRRIQDRPDAIDGLVDAFSLRESRVEIRSDRHYR